MRKSRSFYENKPFKVLKADFVYVGRKITQK